MTIHIYLLVSESKNRTLEIVANLFKMEISHWHRYSDPLL